MCLIKNTHQNMKRLISFTRIEVETRTVRHSGNQFGGLKSTGAEFCLKFLYYKQSASDLLLHLFQNGVAFRAV